jgi:hypothetical protein
MNLQTCRRHPNASRFMATCPGCAQELYDIEQANRARAEAERVAKVRAALGYPASWKPDPYYGETTTHLTVWSQMELNDLFERVGGTVTSRQVERSTSDGSSTWTATEVTLTVQVDSLGPVEVVTDIEDDSEHGYRTDVPVLLALSMKASA